MVAVGLLLAGLLLTAATLSPDRRGFGTHRQMGFPPCTFQVAWGIRCPACGMTTAWAHVVRGHPVRALQANVGGALLAIAAVAAAPWALISGIRGRWLWMAPCDSAILLLSLMMITITLVDWAIRYSWGQWN